MSRVLLSLLILGSWGCGARTDVGFEAEKRDAGNGIAETCDGLDEDGDGRVDEDFRDEGGRYVDVRHCGGCDRPCGALENATSSTCAVLEGRPTCAATACERGYAPSRRGLCVPAWEYLCLTCVDDAACGDVASARCESLGNESRCVVGCEGGCPTGYECDAEGSFCRPSSGSCSCGEGDSFTLACNIVTGEGEGERSCVGTSTCSDGTLSECMTLAETCDERDNDCDGAVDEDFRNESGGYEDTRHCGQCGVSCEALSTSELPLLCGGDPFSPSCRLHCKDADDGIDPGDRIDADRNLQNGCECTVRERSDAAGPKGASMDLLDTNCDGAEGVVKESFYVSATGSDDNPGSPTLPLLTIAEAVSRAALSLTSSTPRPHVFVASGSYAETVELPDGVQLHGGYRPDFLELDPDGYRAELRAPANAKTVGGAALIVAGAGRRATRVEWIEVRGRDAAVSSAPAFGIVLDDVGPRLVLSDLVVRTGNASAGRTGGTGAAGQAPTVGAGNGRPPRAAVETAAHVCIDSTANVVTGGAGGVHTCGVVDVSGGRGGSPSCPTYAARQPRGAPGKGTPATVAGKGGVGGQDSAGPLFDRTCPGSVCCGLADFTVPSDFSGPEAGRTGQNGALGRGGAGCRDPLGRFVDTRWSGGVGDGGTSGAPGGGGGGGGAGGGTVMSWVDGACPYADGLGGGGGGGGAGGCGGTGGRGGTSGGAAVAIVVRYRAAPSGYPTIRNVRLVPGDGGRGGDGGAGGDGGLGGPGGLGGALSRSAQTTPTLAGPFPGGRGGKGGNGGAGGGGGGGCGGSSVGIWLTGLVRDEGDTVDRWRQDNTFEFGAPGDSGRGGGGEAPGTEGRSGEAMDVVVH